MGSLETGGLPSIVSKKRKKKGNMLLCFIGLNFVIQNQTVRILSDSERQSEVLCYHTEVNVGTKRFCIKVK